MLITRLYLRNFRVYEDELNLEVPPGLVGIYGPNGSGKSTLLEAILFTLWGKSRTTRDQIRSSGVGGECVTEVEFEHEGHLYLVRRTLRGINSQMSVEAHCDGNLMSTGTRDAERFVESVLGMDDAAFRASVFTEQKQLAAFSNYAPADRRRLVLQLLGITPLDAARDSARKDARELTAQHDRLRSMLPDLDRLRSEAADAAAAAEAAGVAAAEEARAADAARGRQEAAASAFSALDQRRQEHDALVLEGRAARQEMDTAARIVTERTGELTQLELMAGQLPALEAQAAGSAHVERLIVALDSLLTASRRLEAIEVSPRPAGPAEADVVAAKSAAETLRQELAVAAALAQASEAESERRAEEADKSRDLDAGGDCPTCGQALGRSFATVQAHRRAEADQAKARASDAGGRLRELQTRSIEADRVAARLAQAATVAASAVSKWEVAEQRRVDALAERDEVWPAVLSAQQAAAGQTGGVTPPGWRASDGPPPASDIEEVRAAAQAHLAAKRDAAGRMAVIRSRLEDRSRLQATLAKAQDEHSAASSRVEVLREKVKALGFDKVALDAARDERDRTAGAADAANRAAQAAAVKAAEVRQAAGASATRLADGEAQHANLGDLEIDARHRSRTAELLSEFRNKMVASVGPKLAIQAADLFNELTDHEYEHIEVDGDTYQLKISDGGHAYGLDRFSGSEIDLANLALRVAISEHIHFQSGGSVGLLVLDEVFGPLDDDRKARMLQALERLKGRFRQVLVVTHDTEIKEQLPNAIEVVKRPGRRATARVLGD